MRAYLINLDRAKERLARSSSMLNSIGVDWQRIRGVEGRKVPSWSKFFDLKGYIRRQGRRRIPGEVGCYLSHLKAIKTFYKSGEPYGIIMEDDIVVDEDLPEVLAGLESCSEQWDLVRLSTVNHGKPFKLWPLTEKRWVSLFLTREKGSGAYVLNRHAAECILEKFVPMQLPWDQIYDIEWRHGYRVLFVTPYPVQQNGFESQIQNNIRSYYLPAWKRYWTVFPFRFCVEVGRFFYRGLQIIRFKIKRRPC